MSAGSLTFVVPGDIDTVSGGYGYDRHIIDGLRRRGWDVDLLQFPGTYPFPSDADRGTAARLLASIPDARTTIVDGLACGALPAEMSREQARLRLIALVHHPLGLETGLTESASARLLALEREALSAAGGVIVTSARTIDAVRDLGVRGDCILVVEPGTEVKPVAAGSGGARTNLLCVASLTPRKGHDTLLEGLERIADFDWHLTCVGGAIGDQDWAASIQRRAMSGPLAGRITFAGQLSGATLDAAYDAADLFVLATRYEGYGMVVAEALSRGLPVVSTPTGAIAELVGDTAGFLIGADDPSALAGVIRLFMTDRMVQTRMRQGALAARTRLRDWDAASADMDDAIRRVANR